MLLIAITGLARSGKDTAAKYIAKKYKFHWLDMSRDVLQHELMERNMEITKGNLSKVGGFLRKEHGNDIVAQKIVEIIQVNKIKKAIVSGVRSPEEAEYLRSKASIFYLLRVYAPEKARIARGEIGIKERDTQDISNKGLAKVLEMADIIIENNGTLEEFYRNIDKAMASIA